MIAQEIRDFILRMDLCDICILRYENVDSFEQFEDILSKTRDENLAINDDDYVKRRKLNICCACLGIFHELDIVANKISVDSDLAKYNCPSLYSSIQIPINLLIRELTIWVDLIEHFPGKIDEGKNLSLTK